MLKNKILAAELNLNYDFELMTQEILNCQSHWRYMPPYKWQLDHPLNHKFNLAPKEDYDNMDYTNSTQDLSITKNSMTGGSIFYLTKHCETERLSYSVTKNLSSEGWGWREELNIPYTKRYIESLPYKKIGLVRVFVFKDTFLPVHKDYGFSESKGHSEEYDKCFGLSLIPSTGNVPMKIWSTKLNKVVEVSGNAMLFNDSVWHAVPKTTGYRITIRVFGEVDYDSFAGNVVADNAYFL